MERSELIDAFNWYHEENISRTNISNEDAADLYLASIDSSPDETEAIIPHEDEKKVCPGESCAEGDLASPFYSPCDDCDLR